MTRLAPRLLLAALLVLSMGAGLWMAQSIWRLVQPAQASLIWPQQLSHSPSVGAEPFSEWLRSERWFGAKSTTVTSSSGPLTPVTELPLFLYGVLAHANPLKGSALIAQRGQEVALFRPGDRVFAEAQLVAVYHDSVLLLRDGQQEALRFELDPQAPSSAMAPITAAPNAEPSLAPANPAPQFEQNASLRPQERTHFAARLARDIEQGMAELQGRAQTDPQGLLDQYGLRATAQGYQVTPNAMVLISNGLQPGDLITEINGLPVGNIAQDQTRVDTILSQPEIQLTLVRGSQVFRFTQALRGF